MKNKQPNGQTFGPKMARALLKRCNELEDCVVSQQKAITELQSQITNNEMGHALMKRRYDDAMAFVELKRPDVMRLLEAQTKRRAVGIASLGKLPDIVLKVVKKKRKVKVPEFNQHQDIDSVTVLGPMIPKVPLLATVVAEPEKQEATTSLMPTTASLLKNDEEIMNFGKHRKSNPATALGEE